MAQKDVLLSVKGLAKSYEAHLLWKDVSFDLCRGDSFALLGPNGSGKSTLLKVLMGLVKADSEACIHYSISKNRIAYVPERPSFWPELTAFETLKYLGKIQQCPLSKKRIQKILDCVGLAKSHSVAVGNFSQGMLQRLALALLFIKEVDLYLLDEPSNALDLWAHEGFISFVEKAMGKGKSFVLSSHLISDLQRACRQALVIKKEKIHTLETVPKNLVDLKKHYEEKLEHFGDLSELL